MLCERAVTMMLALCTLMGMTCALQPHNNSTQILVNDGKMHTRMPFDYNESIFIGNASQHCSIHCDDISNLSGILGCFPSKSQGTGQPHLFFGYCISCEAHQNKSEVIIAECPFSIGKNVKNASISLNINMGLKMFCHSFGRTGKLCGECLTNSSINIMSDSFECEHTEFNNSPTNWLKFFAARFASLTVFFIIVIVFHVGVTQAPFNGFVFFSQVVSLRSHRLLVEAGWNLFHHNTPSPKTLTQLLYYPYGVWSLNFMSIDRVLLGSKVCLSRHLKVVHIIMLEYIIAVYPLLLLGIVYVLIELHGRNYRIFVWLWRILCPVCVRIRRSLKYKSSLVDAFVTFLLLSYTKMAVVSFELVSSGPIMNVTGKTVGKALRIDPSVSYSGYQAIAWIVLIIYGGCFPVFLVLYPNRYFKVCLNKFTYCSPRLVQALNTFADAFQGNYRYGRNGEADRRSFAGVYLWFRMLVFFIMTNFHYNVLFNWLLLVYFFLLLFFVVFQPYKVSYFNWLEASFVAILGIVALSMNYLYTSLQITQKITPTFGKVWRVAYALQFIPLLYILCHIIYWIIKSNKHYKKFQFHVNNRPQDAAQPQSLLDMSSEFPDRLNNPENYATNSNAEIAANTPLLESVQDSEHDHYGSLTETDP